MFSPVFAPPGLVFLERTRYSAASMRRVYCACGGTMANRRTTTPRCYLVNGTWAGQQR